LYQKIFEKLLLTRLLLLIIIIVKKKKDQYPITNLASDKGTPH
jgi:hypothetical protein